MKRENLKKWVLKVALVLTMVLGLFPTCITSVSAENAQTGYEIYPTPHTIVYDGGDFILRSAVNVVYEDGIDSYTKDRLNEVMDLKDLDVSCSNEAVSTSISTNVLVGIYDSNGYVDQYVKDHYSVSDDIFDEIDSYFLCVDNGNIVVLGKDTDAAFYGLTTLYHVFTQMDGKTILNFTVEDYADVASRGFIEGYYGNPWSTEDRVELMTWGGYYKLNSYFYAPKDDPKHNSSWRELYTDEELETKIKPLAEAGNASKCRFVYALHPFMYDAIDFSSEESYQADLAILQAKFAQVIEAGVRQIAILADDANSVGSTNYIRLLNDMCDWLEDMQETYPDLKTTLPFCTVEYMGNGETYYAQFPKNVQIVMTGGKVWGEVSDEFTSTFTSNTGRGPYMWVNWPCSDNSKSHLIMGGYSTFLHAGVDPDNIQGIVLNPMQQSEPSKVAIFGNACYSWNIWESDEEADKAWEDSFKYVDHNSAIETKASEALRELSKHMINQNMDSRVTALQESVDLKELLDAFNDALNNDSITIEQIDTLIAEMEILQKASSTYQQQGNTNIIEQISYWLYCWDDTTSAAISYLNALKALINNDTSTLLSEYANGQEALTNSKTYGFNYIDHNEYAEVGVQHIVPWINNMDTYLSNQIKTIVDPSIITTTYISNVFTNPTSGSIDDILDGDDSTMAVFQSPNYLYEGDYVGVKFNKGIDIASIRFAFDGGKNHFYNSKIQYTTDNENWFDIDGATYSRPKNSTDPIELEGLELTNVLATRLIATADNGDDLWLGVQSIDVNYDTSVSDTISYNVIKSSDWSVYSGPESNLYDGNDSSYVWYNGYATVDSYLGYDLGKVADIASLHLVIGNGSSGDKFKTYTIEYSLDNENWTAFDGYESYSGNTSGTDTIDIHLDTPIEAKYVRVRNLEYSNCWVMFSEFTVKEYQESTGTTEYLYTNADTSLLTIAEDNVISLTTGDVTLKSNEYIGIVLENNKELSNIIVDYTGEAVVQTSINDIEWNEVSTNQSINACYVRLINTSEDDVTLHINTFSIEYNDITSRTFLDSNIVAVSGWGDDRHNANAFDGDMTTTHKLGGQPEEGQYIIYDLGQNTDITSLRIYAADSEMDYIRQADVQISNDLENWTTLFSIGDGDINIDVYSTATETYPNRDSNYPNYVWAGRDDLEASGRYLRIYITADYPQRAIVINEIMINHGDYVSIESNKDFVGAVEVEGHQASYMIDGDIATTYKSSQTNASITYNISHPDDYKSVRIVQSGRISNATVTAIVYDGSTSQEITLGSLVQSINEFNIPVGMTLLSITISWEDIIPEISEILLSLDSSTLVDKTALTELLNEDIDISNWTSDSQTKYESAKEVAQYVLDNDYVTQVVIDNAIAALNNAIDAANIKATDEQIDILNNYIENTLERSNYTTASYVNYDSQLLEITNALNYINNLSSDDAKNLIDTMDSVIKALVYSPITKEESILLSQDMDSFIEASDSLYTQVSINNLITANDALKELIEESNHTSIHPDEFTKLSQAVKDAFDGLVLLGELPALINEYDMIDLTIYSEESALAYTTAIEDSRALLEEATAQQITDAIALIKEAKENLIYIADSIEPLLQQAKSYVEDDYTTTTYQALQDMIEKIENKETLVQDDYTALQHAINDLIYIGSLKDKVDYAISLDKAIYTTSTYSVLEQAIIEAQALYDDGDNDSIQAMVERIDEAIIHLAYRVDVETAIEYIEAIEDIDPSLYTKESANNYVNAYQALKDLLNHIDDVSSDEYQALKDAFEDAKAHLTLIVSHDEVSSYIDSIDPINPSLYTQTSVDAYNTAYDALKALLDADEITLDEFNHAKDKLNQALTNLEKLPTTSQDDTTSTTNTNNQTSSTNNVRTGDSSNIAPWLCVSFISMLVLLGYAWIYRKKKI